MPLHILKFLISNFHQKKSENNFPFLKLCMLQVDECGVALIVNRRVQNAVLGSSLKNDRMISARFQAKPYRITVIQVYAPTNNAKKDEVEWFYEDL